MKLTAQSLVPLYQQVMDEIKKNIETGEYPANGRIPSEAELSEMYGVSRVTVRRSIEELANEGYLTKRQGKGTFVNPPKISRKILLKSNVQSFTDTCRESGRTAGAHVLGREVTEARRDERAFFGMGEGAELVHVRRVRTADGVPVMLENNFFPREGFEFLLSAQLEDRSIFSLVEEETGRRPEKDASTTLEIMTASAKHAGPLGVEVGAPLFYEHGGFLDADDRPLCMGKHYIVGSVFAFEI